MRAVLKLEIIGDNYYAARHKVPDKKRYQHKYERILGADKTRPWVAAITGLDERYGFRREFIRGQKDYSLANSVGSRGVYVYYPLKPGIYEVHERLTWKKTRRYFIRVEGEEMQEIDRKEVEAWLANII